MRKGWRGIIINESAWENNDMGRYFPWNLYAYVYEDGRVITADRTSWSDAGTDEYRQATGE